MKKQAIRAFLISLAVFLTGMLAYQTVPTSLDQLWQPALQAALAGLAALGVNVGTKGVR